MRMKLIVVVAASLALLVSICYIPANISAVQTVNSGKPYIIVPIIMYHEVKTIKTGKDVITPYEFESDLKYLKENNYNSITMTDLIDYVYKKKPLPQNPIILSFDDGYLNNYVYAFPMIKKYNMKIVLSIIGKNTDDFTQVKDDNIDYSHLTWNEINEMIKSSLVEVQNHSYNLHSITKSRYGCAKRWGETQEQYKEVLATDITRLQSEMTLFTGKTPNTFTYPYGQVSSASLPIIKELGFKACLTCKYGVNIITDNRETLYSLRRICRSHNYSIKRAIEDGMKTLKYRKINEE